MSRRTVFVMKTSKGLSRLELLPGNVIDCGAGILLSQVAAFCPPAQPHRTGVCLRHSRTLGGGIVMNAGAYGGELKDVLLETRYLTPEGQAVCAGARNSVWVTVPAFCRRTGDYHRRPAPADPWGLCEDPGTDGGAGPEAEEQTAP